MQTTQYVWQHKNWPKFTWDNSVLIPLLSECRLKQGKLLANIKALGLSNEKQAQMDTLLEEAITTSAIEGEKLSRDSVHSSIARKLGLPTAGLRLDRSTDGIIEVLLNATQSHDTPITKERLFSWHAALFPTGYSGLNKITVATWRGETTMQVVSGKIGKEKIHYEAPPSERIEKEMISFIDWLSNKELTIDGLIRAAIAHFWFVTIHPFEDGNGRIARALTDMALSQDDHEQMRYYSLSSQINTERNDYYIVLEESQKSTLDITKWLLWFLGCFSRAIDTSKERMSVVLDKANFWVKHSQTQLSERQRKVINKLLDAGQKGFVGGLTNRKYVAITGVSRQTATRELEYLLSVNVIEQNHGKGRSVNYDISWDLI